MLGLRRRPTWLDRDAVLRGWGGTAAERRAAYARSTLGGLVIRHYGEPVILCVGLTRLHDIRYALAGEFDVAGRIEIAEASVNEDWTKGVGLVDAAVPDGDAARALEFCRRTVEEGVPPPHYLESVVRRGLPEVFLVRSSWDTIHQYPFLQWPAC